MLLWALCRHVHIIAQIGRRIIVYKFSWNISKICFTGWDSGTGMVGETAGNGKNIDVSCVTCTPVINCLIEYSKFSNFAIKMLVNWFYFELVRNIRVSVFFFSKEETEKSQEIIQTLQGSIVVVNNNLKVILFRNILFIN